MTLKINAKFEGKLTCVFKNEMWNLVHRLKNSDFILESKPDWPDGVWKFHFFIQSSVGLVVSQLENLLLRLTPENFWKFDTFPGEYSCHHQSNEIGYLQQPILYQSLWENERKIYRILSIYLINVGSCSYSNNSITQLIEFILRSTLNDFFWHLDLVICHLIKVEVILHRE